MILNDANIKILIIVAAKTEFAVNSHHFSGLVLNFIGAPHSRFEHHSSHMKSLHFTFPHLDFIDFTNPIKTWRAQVLGPNIESGWFNLTELLRNHLSIRCQKKKETQTLKHWHSLTLDSFRWRNHITGEHGTSSVRWVVREQETAFRLPLRGLWTGQGCPRPTALFSFQMKWVEKSTHLEAEGCGGGPVARQAGGCSWAEVRRPSGCRVWTHWACLCRRERVLAFGRHWCCHHCPLSSVRMRLTLAGFRSVKYWPGTPTHHLALHSGL